jgi:hypothetical protein
VRKKVAVMGKKKKKHKNAKAEKLDPVVKTGTKHSRRSLGTYFNRWVNTIRSSYSDIYSL